MDANALGALIRGGRQRLGLNQTEAARAAGVSRELVSKLERGAGRRPEWIELKKLERGLEMPDGMLTAVAGYDSQQFPARERTLRDVARELLAMIERLEETGQVRGGSPDDGAGDREPLTGAMARVFEGLSLVPA